MISKHSSSSDTIVFKNVFSVILVAVLLTLSSHCTGNKVTGSNGGNSNAALDPFEAEMLESLVEASVGGGGALASVSPQCEPQANNFCTKFGYNSTRMPNFFKDSNQYEALERVQHYQPLLESKCSDKIHHYLCELLIPVCLIKGDESTRNFEVYPCKSACWQIRSDCSQEIAMLEKRLYGSYQLPGFNCDQLPFNINGEDGPCDPMESPSESPPAHNPYNQQPPTRPVHRQSLQSAPEVYDKPPFMDTSRIDPNLIRPPTQLTDPALADRQNQMNRELTRSQKPANGNVNNQQSAWTQIVAFGQTLFVLLARHSNEIGVASIIFLLIALNSRRLQRLKQMYLCSSSSSTSSSPGSSAEGSSASSQRPLHPNDGLPVDYRRHLSPSASSRSLMLIAGSNLKQAPKHQLLPATTDSSEPSQQLIHALKHKTLINLNGTLERQQQANARYIQANNQGNLFGRQQNVKQQPPQLFSNTLDSQSSHSNQYDYIQMPSSAEQQQFSQRLRSQQQQQQQMYSNILLSSPSHKVLLMAEPERQQLRHQLGQRAPPPTSQAPAVPQQSTHYLTTSLSPYDSPSGYQQGGPSVLFSDAHHQRSFQRRTKLGSRGSTCDDKNNRLGLRGAPGEPATVVANNYTSPSSASSASSTTSAASNSNSSSALVSGSAAAAAATAAHLHQVGNAKLLAARRL